MENIPDEVLMAYADNALPSDQRRRLEALLARDAELVQRLQPFIVTAAPLRDAISSAVALSGPVPERLIKTVMEAPIRRAPARPGLMESMFGKFFPPAPMLAAGLAFCALAVVAGSAWYGSQPLDKGEVANAPMIVESGGNQIAAGALLKALETAPMRVANVAAGQSATPIVTFRDTDGRFCRQFETKSADETRAGYACRDGNSAWQIGFSAVVAGETAPENSDVARPAGGATSTELEEAINGIIASEAFSKDQESGLIANGWREEAPK